MLQVVFFFKETTAGQSQPTPHFIKARKVYVQETSWYLQVVFPPENNGHTGACFFQSRGAMILVCLYFGGAPCNKSIYHSVMPAPSVSMEAADTDKPVPDELSMRL